jgi:predicted nucleotidyltransferase
MELNEIKNELHLISEDLSSKTNAIECYLFGSILTNPKQANDIDILIIYTAQQQISILKESFNNLTNKYPLHLIFFTPFEEREFNFIKEQRAEKVFSL